MRGVAKRHHTVRNRRYLRPSEIAGFAHAQEAVKVEVGGVGPPDAWFPANQLVGPGDVSPSHEIQSIFEGVVL